MRKNDKMDKGFLSDLWHRQNKTNVTSSTVMSITTSTMIPTTTSTTPKALLQSPADRIAEILTEGFENLQTILIVIIILMGLIVSYKLVKLCRMGYKMHNVKVIKKHESTNTRI